MDTIERRKKRLVNLAYFTVFISLFVVFVKYAFWLVAPFIIAFLVAMLLQRPIKFISSKTHIKKSLLSVVFVILIVLAIFGLLILVGYRLWTEFYDFSKYLSGKFESTTALIQLIQTKLNGLFIHLPDVAANAAREAVDGIAEKLLAYTAENQAAHPDGGKSALSVMSGIDFSFLATPLGGLWSTAKQIPSIVAAVIISIVACFFLTSDYDNFTRIIKNMLSEEGEQNLVKIKHITTNVLAKWCKSYAILLSITCLEVALGLFILKLAGFYNGNYIFVIAVCTALLDILPVFGTGTVLVPWAVASFATHNIGMGIGLVIIYGVITLIRQVLEPRLVSMNVGMHPVITLMAMYLGLQIFGFLGLIILPITLVVLKTLNAEGVIHLWNVRQTEVPEKPAAKKPFFLRLLKR